MLARIKLRGVYHLAMRGRSPGMPKNEYHAIRRTSLPITHFSLGTSM